MLHHSYKFDRNKKERDVTCEIRFKINIVKPQEEKKKEKHLICNTGVAVFMHDMLKDAVIHEVQQQKLQMSMCNVIMHTQREERERERFY